MNVSGIRMSDLHAKIQSALQCLTTSSSGTVIQQVQKTLLQWEDQQTDVYVMSLISLMGFVPENITGQYIVDGEEYEKAANLRLAATLTLKVAIARRWKDRGRGKLRGDAGSGVGDINNNGVTFISEGVKTLVRHSMLSLVLTGNVPTLHQLLASNDTAQFAPITPITDMNQMSHNQVQLLQDQSLQTNAASLLATLARMDLPLKFHELIPTLIDGARSAQGFLHHVEQQRQHHHQQQKQFYETIRFNTIRVNPIRNQHAEVVGG